jgi:hypothetical protein
MELAKQRSLPGLGPEPLRPPHNHRSQSHGADDAEHHATEDRGAELSAEGLGRADVRVRRVALASQRHCEW